MPFRQAPQPREQQALAPVPAILARTNWLATDIAAINLTCAIGLPGAEDLNSAEYLRTLDEWTAHVRSETERHMYRFRSNPLEFDRSEAYFRMLIMAVTLYEDFRVRYNPERRGSATASEDDPFFSDSRDLFLHGLCGNRRLGTCSSMPVLYAAIGRRLGYPLKLATTKSHLFLRWEGPQERFDLETTGKGMNRYDDDHFRNWPYPVTEEEIAKEGYLKSLSPAEEAALFLSLRGHCLRHARRLDHAIEAYAAAVQLAPSSAAYRLLLAATEESRARLYSRIPAELQQSLLPQLPPQAHPAPVPSAVFPKNGTPAYRP